MASNLLFEGPIKYKGMGFKKQYMCPCHASRKNEVTCKTPNIKAKCDAGFINCDHYCSTAAAAKTEDIAKSTLSALVTSNERSHTRSSYGSFVDPSRSYNVQILAENNAGGNVWSLPALSTRRDPDNTANFLPAPEVPAVPMTARVGNSGKKAESNLVYLQWLTPYDQGAPISHFIVETERLDDFAQSKCFSVDEIRVEATIEERTMGTLSRINQHGIIETTKTPFTVPITVHKQEAIVTYPWELGASGKFSSSRQ